MKTQRYCVAFSTFVLVCLATAAVAQQGYKKPPKEVLDILNAPVTPGISISPTRDNIVLSTGLRYPPLADLAQPMLCLAGRRINPGSFLVHLAAGDDEHLPVDLGRLVVARVQGVEGITRTLTCPVVHL